MRRIFAGLGVLALMVAPVDRAEAADPDWLDVPFCTSGVFEVCLGVQNVSWNAGTGELSFSVENLAHLTSTSHTITRFGFFHTGSTWSGSISNFSGPAGWFGFVGTGAGTGSGNAIAVSGMLGSSTNGVGNGITDGESADFTFTLSEEFPIDETTQLAWHSQSVGKEGGPSVKCYTDGRNAEEHPCGPVTVPEPLSALLLGSGLVGIGGLAIRRRRTELPVEGAAPEA